MASALRIFKKDVLSSQKQAKHSQSCCGKPVYARSQIVTLRQDAKFLPYMPFAFTENGVAMLSSVLHSQKAIQVNIGIMRAFTRLRKQFHRVSRFETQPKIQRPQDPVRLIKKIVAKHWGLTIEDLQSAARKKSISLPRQVAIYLIRNQINMSFNEIGWHFGKRDHTTMMHAYRKISAASGMKETLNFLQSKISHFQYPPLHLVERG